MRMHDKRDITLSILVPAYNEESTILEILRRVNDQKLDGVVFEVVVVDDGSKDRTLELLEQNPDLYTKLIKLSRNGGKGAAVRAGLAEATGDFILFQDADLEYDPADYTRLVKPILDFGADLVIGSRLVASEFTRVSYFWHRVGNRFITFVFNILNNTTFTDIYSCYLVYRRDLVDPGDLSTSGWEQQAEILSYALYNPISCYEVPVSYYGRTYGEGKKIKAYDAFAVIWTILKRRLLRPSGK